MKATETTAAMTTRSGRRSASKLDTGRMRSQCYLRIFWANERRMRRLLSTLEDTTITVDLCPASHPLAQYREAMARSFR